MSVTIEEYESLVKTNQAVVIDKSDKKHPNRILRIFRMQDPLDRIRYSIKADWTQAEYHPTMFLEKEDIEDLIHKLQELL